MTPMSDSKTQNLFDPIPEVFDFENFAPKLEALIQSDVHFVPGGLVLSLNAPFGGGKSTFLDLWEKRIEDAPEDGFKPRVIRLNAWEDDHAGDPLASLVFNVVDALCEGKANSPLAGAGKDFVSFSLAMAEQVAKMSGLDPRAAGKTAEEAKVKLAKGEAYADALWNVFRSRRKAIGGLRSELRAHVENSKERIILLVDELDRCRPDYAISYLEAIKHMFDVQGLVFVLAIDRGQLQSIARALFGSGLEFGEYLRKFVHREVALPHTYTQGRAMLVSELTSRFLATPGKRVLGYRNRHDLVERVIEVFDGCRLGPRQMIEVFRICGYLTSLRPTKHQESATLSNWLWDFLFFMAALKIANNDLYSALGCKIARPGEVWQFVSFAFPDERLQRWWLCLLWSSGSVPGMDTLAEVGFQQELVELGVSRGQKDAEDFRAYSQFRESWLQPGVGLGQFYESIESLESWANIHT